MKLVTILKVDLLGPALIIKENLPLMDGQKLIVTLVLLISQVSLRIHFGIISLGGHQIQFFMYSLIGINHRIPIL